MSALVLEQQRRVMALYRSQAEKLGAAVDVLESAADAAFAESRAGLVKIAEFYRERVPFVPLSRCPFTGERVVHSLDPFGLDGLWWNAASPVRPLEQLPPSYFAFTGALSLGPQVEHTPFPVEPGPEVPFVIPALLDRPSIKAVVSEVAVGAHRGFPVFYFAEPVPHDLLRVNDWGARNFLAREKSGAPWLGSAPVTPEDASFDLDPWVRSGKLLWIAPGDPSLTLQSRPSGCPYMRLEGGHDFQCIQFGGVTALHA